MANAKEPQKTVVALLHCGQDHQYKLCTGTHDEAYAEAQAWTVEWMKANPNKGFRIIFSEVTNSMEF